jgi:hypothetical protein
MGTETAEGTGTEDAEKADNTEERSNGEFLLACFL